MTRLDLNEPTTCYPSTYQTFINDDYHSNKDDDTNYANDYVHCNIRTARSGWVAGGRCSGDGWVSGTCEENSLHVSFIL